MIQLFDIKYYHDEQNKLFDYKNQIKIDTKFGICCQLYD